MKYLSAAMTCLALLFPLAGCSVKGEPGPGGLAPSVIAAYMAGAPQADPDGKNEMTRTFAGITGLKVTGYLQHIQVGPSAGDEVVIRWRDEGAEIHLKEGGALEFSSPEPNWRDKNLPNDGSPRFTPSSTLYVELPGTVKTADFCSTIGDISIEGITTYHKLTAKTVNGDISAKGLVGEVRAVSLEGVIGPGPFDGDIVEKAYSPGRTSKHLHTVLPGSGYPGQGALLETVLGSVDING